MSKLIDYFASTFRGGTHNSYFALNINDAHMREEFSVTAGTPVHSGSFECLMLGSHGCILASFCSLVYPIT